MVLVANDANTIIPIFDQEVISAHSHRMPVEPTTNAIQIPTIRIVLVLKHTFLNAVRSRSFARATSSIPQVDPISTLLLTFEEERASPLFPTMGVQRLVLAVESEEGVGVK